MEDQLDWMPGPSDAARHLQLKQWAIARELYDFWGTLLDKHGEDYREALSKAPVLVETKLRYENSVAELQALLGVDAHCNQVDGDLWQSYSDVHKSDTGSRPHGHVTRAEALRYFEERPSHAWMTEETDEAN